MLQPSILDVAANTTSIGYPLFNMCARSGCNSWLPFISAIFQSHLGASWLPSCTKILLKVRTRPAAIALYYSVKNIRNDVRQIIIIIIIIFDEKSQFNSLVWGSLTLAQLPQQRRVSFHTKYQVTRRSKALVLIKARRNC